MDDQGDPPQTAKDRLGDLQRLLKRQSSVGLYTKACSTANRAFREAGASPVTDRDCRTLCRLDERVLYVFLNAEMRK